MSSEHRKHMAMLPFADKLKVLEKLRDREKALAKAREALQRERLTEALGVARDLLQKYDNTGQAEVITRILESFHAGAPDYRLLSSVEMWGGSGALWEVSLCQPDTPEHVIDRKRFWKAISAVARQMERIGVGTARSAEIAKTLESWLNSGID